MSYGIEQGAAQRGIRAEVIDAMVKQIAEPSYKFKQACSIVPTSAWTSTFFREDPTILTGGTGNAIKGVPRGADPPTIHPKWEEVSVKIIKHFVQDNIVWEDIIAGDLNIQARTVVKLTQAVVASVDTDILNSLAEDFLPSRIQSYAIIEGRYWSAASAAIVDDVMAAATLIGKKNYEIDDLICYVNLDDKRYFVNYLISKGSQFPSIAAETLRNGEIGRIEKVTFIASNHMPASYALLVKPKTCATFKELVSLRSTTTEDPYKSLRIRVVEEGKVEVHEPLAICLIKGTAAP